MKQEWYIDFIELWTLSFVSDLRSLSLKPLALLWNKWYIDFIELWTLSFVTVLRSLSLKPQAQLWTRVIYWFYWVVNPIICFRSKKFFFETSSPAVKQEWYIDFIELWTLSFVSGLRSMSLRPRAQLWSKSGILILLSCEPYHLFKVLEVCLWNLKSNCETRVIYWFYWVVNLIICFRSKNYVFETPSPAVKQEWYIYFYWAGNPIICFRSKKYVFKTSSPAVKQEWYIDFIELWTLSFVSGLRSMSLKPQAQLWNKSGTLILLSCEPYHLFQI